MWHTSIGVIGRNAQSDDSAAGLGGQIGPVRSRLTVATVKALLFVRASYITGAEEVPVCVSTAVEFEICEIQINFGILPY